MSERIERLGDGRIRKYARDRESFEYEVGALQRCWSTGVVPHVLAVDDDALAFVMDERGRPIDQVAPWPPLAVALEALARVHACGVQHGDIHAGNVLVDASGRLTFVDFEPSRFPDPLPLGEDVLRLRWLWDEAPRGCCVR